MTEVDGRGTQTMGPPQPAGPESIERIHELLAALREAAAALGETSAEVQQRLCALVERAAEADASIDAADPSAPGQLRAPGPATVGQAQRAALVEAVEHRAVIEQAKGMLMLKQRCDAEAAFAMLVEISRRERRKIRDVAVDLVRSGSRPARRMVVDLTDGGPRVAGGRR